MRHSLGWFAMVVGVLGALVCLLIVPAAWVAHGAAQAEARTLIDTVDGALEQAATQLAAVEVGVRAVRARLSSLQTRAEAVAANPAAGEQARAELRDLLNSAIGVDYQTVRAAYITARERAAAGLTTLNQLARLPGIRAPTDEVIRQAVQIDTQLQAIDAELAALRTALEETELSLSEVAARLARQAGELDRRVAAFDETMSAYTAAVNSARARMPDLAANTARRITTLAVGIMLIALYGIVLHGALFVLGRIWARGTGRAATVSGAAPPRSGVRGA